MSIATWSDEQLNALRQRADPLADALAARLYEHPAAGGSDFGRLGYNQFLNLTDKLEEAPALVRAEGSEFQRLWQSMPREFVDYFEPMELPEWVDPAKLRQAGRMWEENSLGMLVVLFLGSLPACYLMARGIPALYQTDKLANRRYITQRLYETGLMLEAVMDEGGLRILTDIRGTPSDDLVAALNQIDPSGQWVKDGRGVQRKGAAPAVNFPAELLARTLAAQDALRRPKRFLAGPGCTTIKKVRLLHASMRYMLRHPGRFRPATAPAGPPASLAQVHALRTEAWDTASLGLPVNQEDLAYTLLTFGYVIPAGLEKWGWKFSPEEKHAFLHLWRVVGHVIGVEDELMTDDWAEAERIFGRILRHQAAGSRDGIELTNTLVEFIEDYLPQFLGLNKKLPVPAIRDLVGPEADKILAEPLLRAAQRPPRRALWWSLRTVLRLYGWLRRHVLSAAPGLAGLFTDPIHRVSQGLIESCRGAYVRQPFYVPRSESAWVPQYGASPEFLAKLVHWRQRVFKWVMITVAPLLLSALGVCAALLLWLLRSPAAWIAGLMAAACLALSFLAMHVILPRILAARPIIEDVPPLEKPG